MAEDPSDGELLKRWADGERQAGQVLFERHFPSLVRFFHNKVDRDHDDLIQKTFMGCLEARATFRAEGSFRAFLFGIARNVLGKHLRARYREPVPLEFAHVSVAELGASPSQLVALDQHQHVMLAALRRIPLDHQLVLELHYWESMTAMEVGEMLGVPTGTAKTRLRRAKQLLAGELADLHAGIVPMTPTQTRLDTWARGIREQFERERSLSSGSAQ